MSTFLFSFQRTVGRARSTFTGMDFLLCIIAARAFAFAHPQEAESEKDHR
jgi:hypothetical protein